MMEPENAPTTDGMPVWIIKSLAAVVTVNVCLRIAWYWKGYYWDQKFVAIVMLAFLFTIPAVATWGRKETRRIEWDQLALPYMLLMLATSLFGTKL
jgi:hypothetical protein